MTTQSRQFVIGMAGHIDHGKTALVKALTGVDTDRLKEEKDRGITIDLGFAHLNKNITIIDVPGHEKLIKNMVAGVSTIDLVLFVIAADDGIMLQTREHLDIVKLLGISNGLFVITKIDLVEEEWVGLVEEELRDLLKDSVFQDAPICHTSAESGVGIKELNHLLLEKLDTLTPRADDGLFRLPVDRIFSKAGFGTIVTGSVISGSVGVGDTVEILPEKLPARVRGLQTHDSAVEKLLTGYRGAINLAGIQKHQLYRGQILTELNRYEPATLFNAHVSVLSSSPLPLKNLMRVRIHVHTIEVIGRIIIINRKDLPPGQEAFIQVRLEKKIYATFQDRFIIRQFSPQVTLGGGVILDTNPARFRKKNSAEIIDQLNNLMQGNISQRILATFSQLNIQALSFTQLRTRSGISDTLLEKEIKKLEAAGDIKSFTYAKELFFCSMGQIHLILKNMKKELEKYHHRFPGRMGMLVTELFSHLKKMYTEELLKIAIDAGVQEGLIQRQEDSLSLPDFSSQLSDKEQKILSDLETTYLNANYNPPGTTELAEQLKLKESKLREYINILRERDVLVVVSDQYLYHKDLFKKLIESIKEFFQNKSEMKVSDLKEISGTTRKHAIPLLTFLDDLGITRREGDVRLPGPKLSDF
jgi:selenocysteine-specific elongation factor